MTEPTPPGVEKKSRRRSAPRKRAPAKSAADAAPGARPADEATTVETPLSRKRDRPASTAHGKGTQRQRADAATGAADGQSRRTPTDAATPNAETAAPARVAEPAAFAIALDPAPLDEPGGRGDAPATEGPLPGPKPAIPSDGDRSTRAKSSPPAAEPSRRHPARDPSTPTAPATSTNAADLTPPALRPGELIRVPLSVRWRDLDAFNHVNNSKYLSYLEEARLRWMLTVPGMGLDDNVAPVVAASTLNYRRPIGWPGDVVVELFVERLGTTSVTIGHRIIDASEGGVTYCDGNVVMVWIDRTSGRASALPDAVRASCSRR